MVNAIGIMSLGLGIFFCLVLFLYPKKTNSSRWIVLLMIVLLVNSAYSLAVRTQIIQEFPTLYFLFNKGIILHVLVYPMFIAFIQSYTKESSNKLLIGSFLLFPVTLFMIGLLEYFTTTSIEIHQRMEMFLINTRPSPQNVFSNLYLFSFEFFLPLIAIVISIREMIQYFKSGILKETRFVLSSLSGLIVFIFIVRIISNPILIWIYRMNKNLFLTWDLEILFASIFLIVLSIIALKQYSLDSLGTVKIEGKEQRVAKLNDDQMEYLWGQIKNRLIDEKGFRLQNLTISTISKEVGVNSKYLSKAIKYYEKKSFTDLVNYHRITLAKELLLSERFDQLSIEGIASEVGFSSRATFYRVFRNEEGLTPIQFREKQLSQFSN